MVAKSLPSAGEEEGAGVVVEKRAASPPVQRHDVMGPDADCPRSERPPVDFQVRGQAGKQGGMKPAIASPAREISPQDGNGRGPLHQVVAAAVVPADRRFEVEAEKRQHPLKIGWESLLDIGRNLVERRRVHQVELGRTVLRLEDKITSCPRPGWSIW